MQLERCSCVPEAKGHPLEQAEVVGDGSLLHVLWVKAGLMAPLPQVILEKTLQPAALAVKSSMLVRG